MATFTQQHRHIAIFTPLGDDALLLSAVAGEESISELFHFNLDLLSESDSIDPRDIVGKNVTFYIKNRDDEPRYFNGFIKRFTYWGRDDRLSHYRAEIVPWLWFLTRRTDSRIFQNKSVPEIIENVFSELGFTDFEFRLSDDYETREYCVQYHESDFNFVSRLLEEEGIFYFFQHEDGKHTLILGDNKGVYEQCTESEVEFLSTISGKQESDDLRSWEHCYEYTSGKVAQKDYNFEKPADPLLTNTQTLVDLDNIDKFELYDFPGKFENRGTGDALTERRMEAEESRYDRVEGSGICPSFSCGHSFTVARHHHPSEEGRTYVLLSVRHEASAMGVYETGASDEGEPYTNVFTCIPSKVIYRPPRRTQEPRIAGAQTATVVGPEGEEIYTDEYGRVKLQFHWDRYGESDENSSCWVRVAQEWAGKKWGAMFLPRIGQEVVVTFLEGDPDRPLITGRVYNADQTVPYELPNNKTRSTIKSRTTKDGGGFNEIRFEDKKDEEQIFIHAEKDQDVRIKNDSREYVGNDRHMVVKNNQQELVENNKHLRIKGNHEEKIDGSMRLTIGEGDETQEIVLKGDRLEHIQDNCHQDIGGDRVDRIGGDHSLDIAGSMDEKVGDRHAVDAGQEIHLKAGMKVILEAGTQLSIKGPGGFVSIDASGVTIQGNMVKINSGGAAGSGSGASPASPDSASEAEPAEPAEAEEGQPP
ncbi:MAG: type VI secretion system tip protein VgrG [Phycisphaerales bacterium]|nr:MAG: type VI secretion system tip protein VgrG [Phycisphaerales bacterium]